MDISKLVINPQLKSYWSAIDLGCSLARSWYLPLFGAWLVVSLPLFVVLLLALPTEYLWLSSPVIWWLKPFWERGPLWVASRRLFNETIDRRSFLKQLPQVYRKRWFAWLTYARLHPSRAFLMPVTVLEGLSGAGYGKRVQVLQGTSSNNAVWLTVAGAHIEALLGIGITAMAFLLIPNEVNMDYWQWLEQESVIIEYASAVIAFVTMAVVAPFYVCAGFMIYINRRIELEGWDIEIGFRLLAERLQAAQTDESEQVAGHSSHHTEIETSQPDKPSRPLASIAIAALLSASLFMPSTDASAAIPTADSPSLQQPVADTEAASVPAPALLPVTNAAEAKRRIESLKPPEPKTEMQARYRLIKTPEEPEEETESWWQQLKDWFADILPDWEGNGAFDGVFKAVAEFFSADHLFTLAGMLKLLVIFAILTLVGWAIVQAHRWYQDFSPRQRANLDVLKDKPVQLFGLDVTRDSLPDDVARAVRSHIDAGDVRLALALLYRSTLSQLIHRFDFSFEDGFTEQECANIVDASGREKHTPLKPYFTHLTHRWQQLAYAHRPVESTQAHALVEQYEVLFDAS